MNDKEKSPIQHPKKLTELYREFYRANGYKSNAILRPVKVAADAILDADLSLFGGGSLVTAVAAEVFKFMDRVHGSRAEGYPKIFNDPEKEQQKIMEFAEYFVIEIFEKALAGDRARLAGRQMNLLRNTCEFLYRLEQNKEDRARKLVKLYREFYHASASQEFEKNAVLKPIDVAVESILKEEYSVYNREALIGLVSTRVSSLMDGIRDSKIDGVNLLSDREDEQQKIHEFAEYFVITIFEKAFSSDRNHLVSQQMEILRDFCESIYRSEQRKENRKFEVNGEAFPEEEEEEVEV